MNNTYPKNNHQAPVNNWNAWNGFNRLGMYTVANDNLRRAA